MYRDSDLHAALSHALSVDNNNNNNNNNNNRAAVPGSAGVGYSQYSMPRMMSRKYSLDCSSEKGVSVGTSITGLHVPAGNRSDRRTEKNK